MKEKITSREKSYADWYVELVLRAQLADYGPAKGSMVICPRGYAMWELMQKELDARFKATGHKNAYFPLLIPESFLSKESKHVEGFAPELAVVTHGGGEKLKEPLVVRPTSETIIWSMYKKWIQSYRDLPLLINQWANVVRWEKRTRLFLRTTEFLWQEGHTAHETSKEALEETLQMLEIYKEFAQNILSICVYEGKKSEEEKFAGAVDTYGIEALMQNGKSLQAGTSHFLGQNFAKAFDVQYQTRSLSLDYVWASSWGVSTRLIGAVIMSHSDDEGLVIPPKIAPTQVVIIPIYKKDFDKCAIRNMSEKIYNELSAHYRVVLDDDENSSPGWKFAEWELRGACIRIEIGPNDLEKKQVAILSRNILGYSPTEKRKKDFVPLTDIVPHIAQALDKMQKGLLEKSQTFQKNNTHYLNTMGDFSVQIESKIPGYIIAPWDGSRETERAIKEKTKATIRVICNDKPKNTDLCIYSGEKAKYLAMFAKTY